MKKDMGKVKSDTKAKQEVENLSETSITIDTLLAVLGIALVVWVSWIQVFFLYHSR